MKKLSKIFQVHLNLLPKLCPNYQQKMQKMSFFKYFNGHDSGCKHDIYTNDLVFFIFRWNSIRWYISFLQFKNFKIQFHGVLHAKHDTFQSVNTDIFFLSKIY